MNAEELKETIDEWVGVEAKLKHYKSLEGSMRERICKSIFDTKKRVSKGSDKVSVDGYSKVKATFVMNVKVNPKALDLLHKAGLLTEGDMACFKSEIKVVNKALKEVPDDSEVWGCISKEPGMPKLEVVSEGSNG